MIVLVIIEQNKILFLSSNLFLVKNEKNKQTNQKTHSKSNEEGHESLALRCNNSMLVKGEEIISPLNICPHGRPNCKKINAVNSFQIRIHQLDLNNRKNFHKMQPNTSCLLRLARMTSSIIIALRTLLGWNSRLWLLYILSKPMTTFCDYFWAPELWHALSSLTFGGQRALLNFPYTDLVKILKLLLNCAKKRLCFHFLTHGFLAMFLQTYCMVPQSKETTDMLSD